MNFSVLFSAFLFNGRFYGSKKLVKTKNTWKNIKIMRKKVDLCVFLIMNVFSLSEKSRGSCRLRQTFRMQRKVIGIRNEFLPNNPIFHRTLSVQTHKELCLILCLQKRLLQEQQIGDNQLVNKIPPKFPKFLYQQMHVLQRNAHSHQTQNPPVQETAWNDVQFVLR